MNFELSGTPLEFRPMAGWVATSRGIAFHLFYFCLRGAVQARVKTADRELKAGDALWIFPDTPFRIESPEPDRCMVVRFRLKITGSDCFDFALKNGFIPGCLESSGETWIELLKQKVRWEGDGGSLALRAVLAGLLAISFVGKKHRKSQRKYERRFSEAEIRVLFEWLESLPVCARPTLAELAHQLRLSNGYANQLCKRTLGMCAERWLIVQRIKTASRQLEESTLSIGEIAERFGYRSLFFFSRQFRSVMKCSPREWRRQHSA